MNLIQQKQEAMNAAILNGSAMSAFEEFYAERLTMQENNQPPTIGKEANRRRQEEFFKNMTALTMPSSIIPQLGKV